MNRDQLNIEQEADLEVEIGHPSKFMQDINKSNLVKLLEKKDPVIFDIGCHDGKDSLEFRALLPSAKIIAFEPCHQTFSQNRRALEGHDISVVDRAISDVNGKIVLYECQDHTQSSSLRTPMEHLNVFPQYTDWTVTTVSSITLDGFCSHKAIRHIDLIWADINGGERELIEGGQEMLKRTRYLYTEFSNEELYANAPTEKEILEMLPEWEVVEKYGEDEKFGSILLKNMGIL